MKKIHFAFLILILFFSNSCLVVIEGLTGYVPIFNVQDFYGDFLRTHLPMNTQWKYKGKLKNLDPGLIDVNSVYILEKEESCNDIRRRENYTQINYRMLRFWETGHVYMKRVSKRFPTLHDAESLDGILVGYFYVKDKTIYVETYYPFRNGRFWNYEKIAIHQEYLVRDGVKVLNDYFLDGGKYKKYYLGKMVTQPDW